MKTFIFGHTSLGRPILAYEFGGAGPEILILGGVHGDETEGVTLALGLIDRCASAFSARLKLTIVPTFNLDGVLAKTRLNARGVDLNRNLPTKDWNSLAANPRYQPGPFAASEPENIALLNFIEKSNLKLIMSLHSWKPMLNVNGKCRPEAEVLSRWLNYPIVEEIGYPTPGCLGTYTGLERNIPTLTYEIERGLNERSILDLHGPALSEALKISEERFSRG